MASTSVVFDILARDRASDKFDHLGRSADDAQTKVGKFSGFMKSAGRAAAYGLGAGLVVGAGAAVKFAEAAAQDEQAANLMATAFKNNAGATDEQIAATEDWISAQGRALGVADDDLRPALSRLVTATHDVGKAQNLAKLAMDVSAGSGKSLEQVSTALMKAQNGQVSSLSRLGINTKNAAGETISMHEAVKRMADTFGGSAAEKANTFQGKLDRLKLMASEAGESIGAKLIPVGIKLTDWIMGTAVPAVEKFTHEWQQGTGTAGRVRDVLERVKNTVADVTKFLIKHKEAVAVVVGVYLTYKGATMAIAAAQKIAAAAVGIYTAATKVASAATKTWSAMQWLLNAALTANPIGLVVGAVALLAAGFVIAYKKSETFRNFVNKAWDAIKRFVGWTPLGSIISNFDTLKSAVESAVGWVKDLVDWISKIDFGKIKDVAGAIGGAIGKVLPKVMEDSGKKSGDAWFDSFTKALGGSAIRQRWKAFMDGLMADALTGIRSSIADLRDQRNDFANFRGFRQNLFGADISGAVGATTDEAGVTTPGPTGIAALRAFAATQRQNAQQLADDVARLTAMGISQDMLEDLKSQGSSGLAQIHALATASQEDFNAIMADMAEANRLNQIAGNEAAVRLDDQLASMGRVISGMARDLTAAVGQPPTVNIRVDLEGRTIVKTVKAEERATGRTYWYPVTI